MLGALASEIVLHRCDLCRPLHHVDEHARPECVVTPPFTNRHRESAHAQHQEVEEMSEDPFYELPPVHWDDGERFGTSSEMIAEIKRLRKLLDGRDKFIVDQGLWLAFVDQLPATP
jgi:hypothetical protein